MGGRTRVLDYGVIRRNSLDWYSYTSWANRTPTVVKWPSWGDVPRGSSTCVDETHPGPPYRTGGNVGIIHNGTISWQHGSYSHTVASATDPAYYKYQGIGVVPNPISLLSGYKPSELETGGWGDPSSYGATGWNKAKPGKPGASLAQFIGELRDLPRMFRFRCRNFRDIGSQYLNYQFGWRPFLSDLGRFLQTADSLQSRYNFFRNNNGKPLKRTSTIRKTTESTVTNVSARPTIGATGFGGPVTQSSQPTITVTDTDHIWFEGVFQFYIPDLGYKPNLSQIASMFGAYPNPSVVWELVPWSWLVDWFSNVGDVMSNLSDSEAAPNLVAKYAYVMRHRTRVATYGGSYHYVQYYNMKTLAKTVSAVSSSCSMTWESKTRVAASPYGFGLTWDGFSPRQLAILAALGISRYG